MIRTLLVACLLLAWFCGTPGCHAPAAAETLEQCTNIENKDDRLDCCAKIENKDNRLDCYDDIAHQRQKFLTPSTTVVPPPAQAPKLEMQASTPAAAPKPEKQDTAPATAEAAGDLAGCSVECKGEKEKCDADRLRCYDDKAKYSWSMCMFGGPTWIKESPGSLNACKYFFEDTERLYGYDKLVGLRPKEITRSYLSMKWKLEPIDVESLQLDVQSRRELVEKSRQLEEKRGLELDEKNRQELDEKILQLDKEIIQLDEKIRQALAEQNRQARLALAYRQNYILLGMYNSHMEKQLWESVNPGMELQDYEIKYQLSLKLKLFDITDNSVTGDWERHLGMHIDLWLAYTQLSFWQVYNASISRPFRETNYEPELILNGRMDKDLFYDWKLRFIQIALNHQSNGQSDPLSRSWNRMMFNFGFERKNFDVVLRTWYRFPEGKNDDNPDIESYLGYGELSAGYRGNLCGIDWRFSLMFRNNLRFDNENRSALQLGVEGNLFGPLNLYVQYFTGYGDSLLDYNSYANTIGVGVSIKDW